MRALDTAMQKAKQVGQHPSLKSYCDLEQFELTSDLRCVFVCVSCIVQQDELVRSLKVCLKINIGNAKIGAGPHRRARGPNSRQCPTGMMRPPPSSTREPVPLSRSRSRPISDSRPNVIMEEIEQGGGDKGNLKSSHQLTTASSKKVIPAHLSELQQATESPKEQSHGHHDHQENTEQRLVPVSNRAGKDVGIADFLVSEDFALKERRPR
ncbi:hypothetical protein J4Q44_G00146870 [Coregonus suidteri]|uniref:Uncharacterized protein n=1 Tax=Coregonus suidteri TaxID=861788 RepID=A0AAN8LR28_9TELE